MTIDGGDEPVDKMPAEDTPLSDDDYLILTLLTGVRLSADGGSASLAFLSGESEQRARSLLADLLRSDQPIHPSIRLTLAAAIDPNPTAISLARRKIVFKDEGLRQERKLRRHFDIAEFIFALVEVDDNVEAAAADAMKQFGIGRSTAMKAWGRFGPALKLLNKTNKR
jgi:uncharacterized protein with PIN domain